MKKLLIKLGMIKDEENDEENKAKEFIIDKVFEVYKSKGGQIMTRKQIAELCTLDKLDKTLKICGLTN